MLRYLKGIKMINKTDLVFYLSTLAGVGSLFVKLATSSSVVSSTVLTWVSIVSTVIAFVAFEFYEYFNGTNPPPTTPLV